MSLYGKLKKQLPKSGGGYKRRNKFAFKEIIAAKRIASKFLSVIGKGTKYKELKKKKRGNLTIEDITEAIHEHKYDKMNESLECQDGEKTREKKKERKQRPEKEEHGNHKKYKTNDCNRCSAPNWSKIHECSTPGKKCAGNCRKIGQFARVCCTTKQIRHIKEEDISKQAVYMVMTGDRSWLLRP